MEAKKEIIKEFFQLIGYYTEGRASESGEGREVFKVLGVKPNK